MQDQSVILFQLQEFVGNTLMRGIRLDDKLEATLMRQVRKCEGSLFLPPAFLVYRDFRGLTRNEGKPFGLLNLNPQNIVGDASDGCNSDMMCFNGSASRLWT